MADPTRDTGFPLPEGASEPAPRAPRRFFPLVAIGSVALLALVIVAGFAVGCSVPARIEPSTTIASEPPAGLTAAPSSAISSSSALVTPMPAPSPTPRVAPSSTAVPTAASSPAVRVVGLGAIVTINEGERFETFGGEPIRLESVWSPQDLGLGGTCVSDAWLECGLEDWLIQPSREYDGPRLDLFYAPGVRERLGRNLRPGEGPFDVVGHFGDPASRECQPENRDECRDRFVVTAIDLGV
jgi:hypothetical protein